MSFWAFALTSCEQDTEACAGVGTTTGCESCCIGQGLEYDLYDPITGNCYCK
jgi:hypothetical protein